MKIIISNTEFKVEIFIHDDSGDCCQSCCKCEVPPKYPTGGFPISIEDKRKMDKQVEAANHILEEG